LHISSLLYGYPHCHIIPNNEEIIFLVDFSPLTISLSTYWCRFLLYCAILKKLWSKVDLLLGIKWMLRSVFRADISKLEELFDALNQAKSWNIHGAYWTKPTKCKAVITGWLLTTVGPWRIEVPNWSILSCSLRTFSHYWRKLT
jgi:hypothetical protein